MKDPATIEERAREYVHVAKYLSRNPTELRTLPKWIELRSATPTKLRLPWWPFPVTDFVREILPAGARVFEFGAGGSTLWLEDLGAMVTAVEHDAQWFQLLQAETGPDTTLILREPEKDGRTGSEMADGYFDSYLAVVDAVEPRSLDLVIVDGRCRVEAGLRGLGKIRPGGWLLLDDSWRPRYRRLGEMLEMYESRRFEGLRPAGGTPSTTTCWCIDGRTRTVS
jgi:hypothetical protein